MPNATKKRKPAGRTVRPAALKNARLEWPHFERVSAFRVKLKPEFSRTYYALASLLADEFDLQRTQLTNSGPVVDPRQFGYSEFLKHGSAALRMLAERLLKSFRIDTVAQSERYSLEQWQSTVARLSRKKELFTAPEGEVSAPAV